MKRSWILLFAAVLVLAVTLALPRTASAGCELYPIPSNPDCEICTGNPDTGCCVQVGPCRCRDQICPFGLAAQSSANTPDWWTAVVAPVLTDAAVSQAGSSTL